MIDEGAEFTDSPTDVGRILPQVLWAKVNARRIHRGLLSDDLAREARVPRGEVVDLAAGRGASARTLLALEHWLAVRTRDR